MGDLTVISLQTRIFRQLFSTAPAHKTGQPIDGYEIKWEKKLMIPRIKQDNNRARISQTKKINALINESIQISENQLRLLINKGKGKVTDCGYDSMGCIYSRIPAGSDFIFEADMVTKQFLHEPGPSNQEAFGIFIRDTMDPDPETGMYYSNMAAIGGYYGRWNVFGRSGITPKDIGHVSNILLYDKTGHPGGTFEKDLLHYRILPEKPLLVHLKMIRQGNEVTAVMRDAHGRDLLAPEFNGGPDELCKNGRVIRDREGYKISIPPGMFCSRNKNYLFFGFFTAMGTEIFIEKDSVQLTILNKNNRHTRNNSEPDAFIPHPEDEFPEPLPGWDREDPDDNGSVLYASPDGYPNSGGSADQPLDIRSAVSRCADGETVYLLPGTYHLTDDLTLDREHSGQCGARRHLCCGSESEQKAVLDFSGTPSALRITGDFWDVSNLRVTNGFGIIIEGSYNRIRDCRAYRNLETGILIRHHLNDSSRSVWPSNNLVEDCFSWENRDPSEYHADGFACKVAAGEGNCFRRCISWLNTDDGFDLFSKNRKTGSVLIENCESCLNGYKRDENGNPVKTTGNGNGFKLGGSGLFITHQAVDCISVGNKGDGFTNNSNPYMHLERCRAQNNGKTPFRYFVYEGSKSPAVREIIGCTDNNIENFQMKEILRELDLRGEGKAE